MKQLELGVFLPIGNNGYLMSKTAPRYQPSFALNAQISQLAERLGFDYVFSMSKWRGFGGETEFWDHTLESVTLMTGLAAVTRRIKLIGTVSPPLLHPAVAAKVTATVDEISQGRFGINVVTGASPLEYEQMGVLPPGYDADRYGYAEEWIQLVKRLWAGERVTVETRYFRLQDCQSSPRPIQKPHPFIVCAGTSAEGFQFTARQGAYSFLAGNTVEDVRALSRRMRQTAGSLGRTIKTASPLMVILGHTDEAARAEHQRYRDGVDVAAIENLVATYTHGNRASALARIERTKASSTFAVTVLAGSAHTVARQIWALAEGDGLDSILLVFPDYLRGLTAFRDRVVPLLRAGGFRLSVR